MKGFCCISVVPMFRTKERLSSTLVKKKIKKGTLIGSGTFRVRYLPVKGERRVAVVISKKTIKGRVQRNRERRRTLHLLKELLPIGYHMVVMINRNTQDLSQADLKQSLVDLMTKVT